MKPVHVSALPNSAIKKNLGRIIALICVASALGLALYVEIDSYYHPSTNTGTIDADVVHVSALVGGRVLTLPFKVNQHVHKGDLLFAIDPQPYLIALHQAEAGHDLAQANFEEQERQVSVKTSNAQASIQSLKQAREERGLAARTVTRLKPLAEKHYISTQDYDQARTRLVNAEASVSKATENMAGATTAIGDLKRSEAALKQSEATLEHAHYELDQTKVYAPVNGYISSLDVKIGEVLSPGRPLFTLIADDEWFAMANIREINLKPVKPGDCATIYSMIDRHTPLRGHVESIGRGVMSDDMHSTPGSVPYVERQMNWVLVSQRFPVRIQIETIKPDLLRMGATATIEILHGAACR